MADDFEQLTGDVV